MKRKAFRLLILAALFVWMSAAVSAAGFTDWDSIAPIYREAVDRMTARGVINGFPDGSFQPEGTLTREQGAKIVTYMVLGDEAEKLTCAEAPFDDVEADRWSAPCIAWCAEREILLGYGDGKFGPTDALTGDQFAKMLLCAFGLAREGNYKGLGDAWFEAVREDALKAGLYEGDGSMATDLPITRQQAALLAWNTVKAAAKADSPDPAATGSDSEKPGKTDESETPVNPVLPVTPVNPGPGDEGPDEDPEIDDPFEPVSGDGEDIELPDLP